MKIIHCIAATALLIGIASTGMANDSNVRRFPIGEVNVFEIIDSPNIFTPDIFKELGQLPQMRTKFPGNKYESVTKVFIIKAGNRVMLVDSGLGGTEGKALESMKALGITPADITDIIMTHLDPDHVGGLISNRAPVFPNARLIVARPEYDAWINDKGLKNRKPEWVELTKSVLAAYKDRLHIIDFGDSIFPGIVAVSAVGHTPGHTAYEIHSGDKSMIIAGDFLHVAPLQLSNPELNTIWDAEGAVDTRKKLLEKLRDSDMVLAGMHIIDVGHVRRTPSGAYEIIPIK